ncbi:MAG: tetratricopeptide repeat protein, partial [Gammaproteobacteria bacterium]|nr:tetratricopeptide repeat protein [Gammaproteobacteria bacterium]
MPVATQSHVRLLILVLITLLVGCTSKTEDVESFGQYLENATAYREQGKIEEAVIELKNALQSNPRSLETRAALGDLYLMLGDAASADKEFRHVQGGRADPSLYMIGLGDALLRLRSWQDVLDRIQPDPGLSVADQARVHAQYGSAYIGLENLESARRAFKKALELDANCAAALLGQAALSIGEGRLASARQLIDQARAMGTGEDAAEAWRLTAELARLEGDNDRAEAAYTKAIELTGFKGILQVARADLRTETGDYDGA